MALFHRNHVLHFGKFVLLNVACKLKFHAQPILPRLYRYLELASLRSPCDTFDTLATLPQFWKTSARWAINCWLFCAKQLKKGLDELHDHAGTNDAARDPSWQPRVKARHITILYAILKSEDKRWHSEASTCLKTILSNSIAWHRRFTSIVVGRPTFTNSKKFVI